MATAKDKFHDELDAQALLTNVLNQLRARQNDHDTISLSNPEDPRIKELEDDIERLQAVRDDRKKAVEKEKTEADKRTAAEAGAASA